MEDLRRSWKVPYVVYFCNLFENKLDLIDLRIDEFEEALIDDCGMERNIVIIHLLQKLLKAFVVRSIDLTNFESILLSVLKKYNVEHLFLQNKEQNQWSELSMLTKLDIIYTLCEFRLQLIDVELKITEYEPSDLRIEPIGVDSNGNTLWYFGDLRLYEEKAPVKEKEKKKEPEKKADKKKSEPAKKSDSKKSVSKKKQPQPTKKQAATKTPATPAPKTPTRSSARESVQKSPEKATPVATGDRPATRSTRSSLALQQTPITPVVTPSHDRSTRSRRRLEEAAAAAAKVEETKPADEEMKPETVETAEAVKSEPKSESESVEVKTEIKSEENEEEIKVEVEKDEPVVALSDAASAPVAAPSEQDEKAKRDEEMQKESDRQQVELYNELVQQAKDEQAEKAKNRPVIEEKEEYKNELKYWSCICMSLEDWTKVTETYKASKKKPDQEIAKILEENYLPEMPALFQKAEKERMHRLLAMAPKRQSQRLQVKQQAQAVVAAAGPATKSATTGAELTNGHHGPVCYAEYSSSDEYDEQRVSGGRRNHHSSSMSSLSSAAMLNENGQPISLTEQERMLEKQRQEEIARQREERLKQRQMRREYGGLDVGLYAPTDETSQASNCSGSASKHSSDFNIKNYFLMHKVLSKILAWNYSWPFKNAVSEEDAPNYSTIIQNPMDLSTIQLRINSKAYKSRQAFVQDLELIVENCITYNGEDSFYGKLALKFEHFYKRWLQIFYPREISTSLEEKNRQLMKMLVNRNNPNAPLEDDDEANRSGADGNKSADDSMANGESGGNGGNENEADMNNENRALVFDLNGMKKKPRRPPNPDRDKYIQEPQYVTKRTSSGRLVKMKIITDYDYTSDQEQDNKKKRKELDEDGVEGIQRKHRKAGHQEDDEFNSSCSMSDSEMSSDHSSDDEDFLGNKRKTPKRYRTTPAPVTRSRSRPVKPMTVSGLLNRANMSNNSNTFVDDDDDEDVVSGVLRNRYIDSDSDEDLKDLSKFNHTNHLQGLNQDAGAAASGARAPLTFEQYVKKLTGSYTLKSADGSSSTTASDSATAGGAGTATVNGYGFYSNTTNNISIKVSPAQSSSSTIDANSSSKTKSLNIPVVNPALINKVPAPAAAAAAAPAVQTLKTNTLGRMTINEIINSSKQAAGANVASASPNAVKIITVGSPASLASASAAGTSSTASPTATPGAKPVIGTILNGNTITTGSPLSTANKKFVIINAGATGTTSATAAAGQTVSGSPSSPAIAQLAPNQIKIINLSQLNGNGGAGAAKPSPVSSLTSTASPAAAAGAASPSAVIKPQILTPILNRPIIMINTANGMANLKQQATAQILNAIPLSGATAVTNGTASVPTTVAPTPTVVPVQNGESSPAGGEQEPMETSAPAAAPAPEPDAAAKSEPPTVAASTTTAEENAENTFQHQTLVSLVNNINEAVEANGGAGDADAAMSALGSTSAVLKASPSIEAINV